MPTFNPDVHMRTLWPFLHYSSNPESFHSISPSFSHCFVFTHPGFVFIPSSPACYSDLLALSILIFWLSRLSKFTFGVVPSDKLVGFLHFEKSGAGRKIFVCLGGRCLLPLALFCPGAVSHHIFEVCSPNIPSPCRAC